MGFTDDERRAIRALVQMDSARGKRARATRTQVPLAEVQAALGLPPLPYLPILSGRCWLGGGRILRWLLREPVTAGDSDFFFPSLGDFNRAARDLLAAGCRVRYLRQWKRVICHVCGREAERSVPPEERRELRQGRLYPVRCPEHGISSGPGADPALAERLVELTPEMIVRAGLTVVEMDGPAGELIQLALVETYAGPLEFVARGDISLTSVLCDGTSLHFSCHLWTDLFARRFRAEFIRSPPATFNRLLKYWRKGFSPYPETVLRILATYVQWKWERRRTRGARRPPSS